MHSSLTPLYRELLRHALVLSAPSVLIDLAALHVDVARCRDVDLAAAFQRDVLATDGDGAVLLHGDAGTASLDGDLITGVDHQIALDLESVVLADIRRAVAIHVERLIATDLGGLIGPD